VNDLFISYRNRGHSRPTHLRSEGMPIRARGCRQTHGTQPRRFRPIWDGFRLAAKIAGHSVTLYSRSGLIVSDNYKPIAKALEKTKKDAVIDGELVALDEHGISRLQLLQNALNTTAHLDYCVFDIMFEDGKDLRGSPTSHSRLTYAQRHRRHRPCVAISTTGAFDAVVQKCAPATTQTWAHSPTAPRCRVHPFR
jgi:hypothetical protein